MGNGGWDFYAIDAYGDPLDGTAGARNCTLLGVVKQNSPGSCFLVANEFICGRLALLMGLPIPPGGIVKLDDTQLAYVSLRFGPRGETPPPADTASLLADHAPLALALVAFDCWIANDDRHESNLAYSPGYIDPMVFDHDKALFGATAFRSTERLEKLRDTPILNGCLAENLTGTTGIGIVAERAIWLAKHLVPGVCEEAVRAGAITRLEGVEAIDFLTGRATNLVKLMKPLMGKNQQGEIL